MGLELYKVILRLSVESAQTWCYSLVKTTNCYRATNNKMKFVWNFRSNYTFHNLADVLHSLYWREPAAFCWSEAHCISS